MHRTILHRVFPGILVFMQIFLLAFGTERAFKSINFVFKNASSIVHVFSVFDKFLSNSKCWISRIGKPCFIYCLYTLGRIRLRCAEEDIP